MRKIVQTVFRLLWRSSQNGDIMLLNYNLGFKQVSDHISL